jgi:hypothetical protein
MQAQTPSYHRNRIVAYQIMQDPILHSYMDVLLGYFGYQSSKYEVRYTELDYVYSEYLV